MTAVSNRCGRSRVISVRWSCRHARTGLAGRAHRHSSRLRQHVRRGPSMCGVEGESGAGATDSQRGKRTPHVPLGVARGARWPRARTFRVRVETCLLSASSRQVCRTWLHFVHLWRHDGLIDARRAAIALRGFCARRPQAASSGKSAEGVLAQHPEPAMGSLRKVLAGPGAAPWCRTRPGCGQAGCGQAG